MSWARAARQLWRARGSRHGWSSRVPTHSPVGFLWTGRCVEAAVLMKGMTERPLTEGESPGLTTAPRGRGQRMPPRCPLAGAHPSSVLTPPAPSLPLGPGSPQSVGLTWNALGFSLRDPTNQRLLSDGPRSTTAVSTAAPPGPRHSWGPVRALLWGLHLRGAGRFPMAASPLLPLLPQGNLQTRVQPVDGLWGSLHPDVTWGENPAPITPEPAPLEPRLPLLVFSALLTTAGPVSTPRLASPGPPPTAAGRPSRCHFPPSLPTDSRMTF